MRVSTESFEIKKMKDALVGGCQEKCLEELVVLLELMQEGIFSWQYEYSEWASVLYLSSYFAATRAFPPLLLTRYAPSSVKCSVGDGTVSLVLNLWNEELVYTLQRDASKNTWAPAEEEFYTAVQKFCREHGDSAPSDAAQGALLLLCMFGENETLRKALALKALDPYEEHPAKLLVAGRVDAAEKAAEEFSHLYSMYFAAEKGGFDDMKQWFTNYVEPYCPVFMRQVLYGEVGSSDVVSQKCTGCQRVTLELRGGYCCTFCEHPEWNNCIFEE
jgi:hypothetical protein